MMIKLAHFKFIKCFWDFGTILIYKKVVEVEKYYMSVQGV